MMLSAEGRAWWIWAQLCSSAKLQCLSGTAGTSQNFQFWQTFQPQRRSRLRRQQDDARQDRLQPQPGVRGCRCRCWRHQLHRRRRCRERRHSDDGRWDDDVRRRLVVDVSAQATENFLRLVSRFVQHQSEKNFSERGRKRRRWRPKYPLLTFNPNCILVSYWVSSHILCQTYRNDY